MKAAATRTRQRRAGFDMTVHVIVQLKMTDRAPMTATSAVSTCSEIATVAVGDEHPSVRKAWTRQTGAESFRRGRLPCSGGPPEYPAFQKTAKRCVRHLGWRDLCNVLPGLVPVSNVWRTNEEGRGWPRSPPSRIGQLLSDQTITTRAARNPKPNRNGAGA